MNKLINNLRPTVQFDPANKEHREHFATFTQNRSWSQCPVRFDLPGNTSNNLAYTIQRKLIAYYMSSEFGTAINENVLA